MWQRSPCFVQLTRDVLVPFTLVSSPAFIRTLCLIYQGICLASVRFGTCSQRGVSVGDFFGRADNSWSRNNRPMLTNGVRFDKHKLKVVLVSERLRMFARKCSTRLFNMVWSWFFCGTVFVCQQSPYRENDKLFWIFPVVLCHAF